MNTDRDYELDIWANKIALDIEKAYERFGVKVEVLGWRCINGRIIYLLKIKKGSRMKQLLAYAEDVQRRLKLPFFSTEEKNFNIFLVVSDREIEYPDLPAALKQYITTQHIQQMKLPCVIGYTSTGEVAIVDLANGPHLLMGGSSNSGKTTGQQALITSIAYIKSPSKVSFVMIDVGADGLLPFNGIPHLACPVITERGPACRALASVLAEMKRRNELKCNRPLKFRKLPQIVVVIDELPELMRASDKNTTAFLVNSINSLLERGRHTKQTLSFHSPVCIAPEDIYR